MTTILIKKRDTAGAPTAGDLTNAAGGVEIAVNTSTKRVYSKDSGGNIIELGTNPTSITTGAVSATQVNITGQGDLRLEDTTGGEYVALQAPASLASSYTLTLPIDDGTNGQALITDGNGNLSWSTAASGDVYGPASATDNAVARFDLTTGKLIQNSVVTIGDTGDVAGVGALSMSGAVTLSGGTANGVAYLNGSKVLTTGSALTFDGTALSIDSTSNNQIALNCQSGSTGTRITFSRAGVAKAYFGDANSITGSNLDATALITTGTNPLIFGIGSEQMRLTSTGLGIGTSSPSAKLHVSGGAIIAATGTESYLENRASSANYILFENAGGSAAGYIAYSQASNYMAFSANGSERMRIDSSGNLGLGVTPSAWLGNIKAVEMANGYAAFYGNAGDGSAVVSSNAYKNSSNAWTYKNSDYASFYEQITGRHRWFTAPSGTAGNAISFTQAMTLDASGTLLVGTTTSFGSGERVSIRQATDGLYKGLMISSAASQQYVGALSVDASGLFRIQQSYIGAGGSYQPIAFDVGGSERMRIDSSGNVGIGTSSTSSTYILRLNSASSNLGFMVSGTQAFTVGALSGGGGAFYYGTGNVEAMRIDSFGNLLVGTTSQLSSGKVSILYNSASENGITLKNSSTTYNYNAVTFRNSSNTEVGYIYTNATGTAYSTSSDYRLKENIQPMQNALAVVQQLNPVTYTWKADGSDGQGFIAHELQAVVPDCVIGEKDAVDAEGNPVYQGIDTSFLVATLTKAIQEQQEQINQLKAEVAALKAVN